jgi:hypothetical protein
MRAVQQELRQAHESLEFSSKSGVTMLNRSMIRVVPALSVAHSGVGTINKASHSVQYASTLWRRRFLGRTEKQGKQKMSTIFISHSSADNALAVELLDWLKTQGYRSVFLDLDPEEGIEAGER